MSLFEKVKKSIINYLISQMNKKINNSISYKSSTTKHLMTSNCTLKFSAETEKIKQEINEKLKGLIKKYINSPEKLIQFMQLKGCKVYKFNNADKLLTKLGEEEGFLTPLKGYKAFIINLFIGILFDKKLKISFSTGTMFIFNSGSTEIYTIARALHKYYGYKKKLPGFDYASQEIFKKVYQNNKAGNASPFDSCSVKDMFACKEAIARDLESIKFTVQLSMEYEQSKKALAKLKETNSAKV